MEVRLNLILLAALVLVWGAAEASAPRSRARDPHARDGLRAAEDAFARDAGDVAAARTLASAYVEGGRPELALSVLVGAPGAPLDDPYVAHRVAMAYEAAGRVDEALALVASTHDRCARALGVGDAGRARTPVPRFPCNTSQHAALAAHRRALALLRAWGVADPTRDPRTPRAYDLALRRARVASASAPVR